jgi:WD40 repeat protein
MPLPEKHPQFHAMSFSPDGKLLATVGWDGVVRLWDCRNCRLQRLIKIRISIMSVAFSPDSKRLALGLTNGMVETR